MVCNERPLGIIAFMDTAIVFHLRFRLLANFACFRFLFRDARCLSFSDDVGMKSGVVSFGLGSRLIPNALTSSRNAFWGVLSI